MKEKLYIFDLDGTLYEGTDHFDYYADRLSLDVPKEKQHEFWKDYEEMKAGKHQVSIGKAYDVKNDAVLTIDPMSLTVIKAVDWEGNSLDVLAEKYRGKQVKFDFKEMIAIGDGWWLPFVCAVHYGVEDCYPRYVETKAYMSSDQFELEKIPHLKSFLNQLKEEATIVLITNSDEEDVRRLLTELDLDGVFHEVITSAKKPTKTTAYFEELKKKFNIEADEIVSIGDNFINEIAPALLLGMNAVYISEHIDQTEHHNLIQVKRISEWIELMEQSKKRR
ncbi:MULTISPECIES: HAD family hydrolase [Bacillaceae]|uniref:HAD family hydrolase n=1 Tax=Evansella alkalicola TaxID=745819 RepID=A0ABS6JXZ4_9BACI|nr:MULTISPECIES: HAD family hydrolase [Bacillaceae]MBU9723474.1 HAD family hydrolase [Bacillus alkalicola]